MVVRRAARRYQAVLAGQERDHAGDRGPGSRSRALPRSKPRFCRYRRAMRPICMRRARNLIGADGERAARYLRTSPEFACKKLLAAGETKIFEFARVFRDRERGDLHLPEFTMLEWYRANATYDAVMADSVVVIAHAAQATGIGQFSFRGRTADPFAEPEMLTVASAFERFAGIDLLATIDGRRRRPARWRRRPRRGCGSPTTTPGRTSSARCWSSTSNQIWGRDV